MNKRKMQLFGWYPQREKPCKSAIEEYEEMYKDVRSGRSLAGVVPHAGWTFSGKLAAVVIRVLAENQKQKPDTVVIYGGHLGKERVALLMADDECETPFGTLEVDKEFTEAVRGTVPTINEESYMIDNTIEIQLPFVKYYFPDSKIIGLRPPMTELAVEIGEQVSKIAEELGRKICVLGSTDMTHYGPNYAFAPKGSGQHAVEWVKTVNDKGAIDLMLTCDAEDLIQHAAKNKSACSAGAPAALIGTVKHRGINEGELIDYYTSYDVMPGSSFVGYAGIVY